jgi:tetratricopeptide (TPR) repeat protein
MLAAADRAIAADPQYEWGFRLRAHALLALRRPKPAEAAAREALALAPWMWQTHATLADALLRRGGTRRIVAARRYADQVLRLAPHEADAHVLDAAVLARMSDLRRARQACQRALAIDPQCQAALHNLAVIDLARDRVGAAARKFTDALSLAPHDTITGQTHGQSARGVLWRLFDALALAVAAHVLLFNAIERPLGAWRRPVEFAAAALVLAGFGWLAKRTWAAQPRGIRWRLRADIRKAAVVFGVILMGMAAVGLLLSAYDPSARSVADRLRTWFLIVPFAVLVVRLRNILARRLYLTARRIWFKLWTAGARRLARDT